MLDLDVIPEPDEVRRLDRQPIIRQPLGLDAQISDV
jgi:hypothetical protein